MIQKTEKLTISDLWGENPTEFKFEFADDRDAGSSHFYCAYLENIEPAIYGNQVNYAFGGLMQKDKSSDFFALGHNIEVSNTHAPELISPISMLAPTPLWMILLMFFLNPGFTKKWLSYTRHTLKMIAIQLHKANANFPPLGSHIELLHFIGRFGYVSTLSLRVSAMSEGIPLLHCLVVQSAINKALSQFQSR